MSGWSTSPEQVVNIIRSNHRHNRQAQIGGGKGEFRLVKTQTGARFVKTRHGGQAQTESENLGQRIGEFRFVKTQTEAEFVRIRHGGKAQTESENLGQRIGGFRFVKTRHSGQAQTES